MDYNIKNEILTIYLTGQLNSSNAEDTENKIDEILEKRGFFVVKIDMNDLEYISSAGLRIIVKIKKQYNDTALINVPEEIYDILEMVGFTNMMEIVRK